MPPNPNPNPNPNSNSNSNPNSASESQGQKNSALFWVEQSKTVQAEVAALSRKEKALLEKIKKIKSLLAKNAPLEERMPLWALEEQRSECLQKAVELDARQRRYLQKALVVEENSVEALEALVKDCIIRHQQAACNREIGLAASIHAEALEYMHELPDTSTGYHQGFDYFEREHDFQLNLSKKSIVTISRFEHEHKRQQPKPIACLNTDHVDITLPNGSYQLSIEAKDHPEFLYPFLLEHGRNWQANKDDKSDYRLSVPSSADVGPEDIYVPEGWCYIGGDLEAPNSLAQQRVWVDGFIIRETPITHGQYLAFINQVLASEGEEEANLWLPREQSTSENELGAPIYVKKEKYFEHASGHQYNEYPVVHITWYQALAYTQWLSEKTGCQWRLPMELEWEKAARGVDRRCFPWGDQFDSLFCVMMDSHIGNPEIYPVRHNPYDVSLYGLRSMAGNTREWCLDCYESERYPVENERLVAPTLKDLTSDAFRSCRGGSYGNAASRTRSSDRDWWFPGLSYVGRGFRIARSWPETEASKILSCHLGRAYQYAYANIKRQYGTAEDHIQRRVEKETQVLRQQSVTDGLTGLYNRRYFDECIEKAFHQCLASSVPLSVAICDVDFFKRFNDTLGHVEGDRCLSGVAAVLKRVSRSETDIVARYGGEEFVFVLKYTTLHQAHVLCERVRQTLLTEAIKHPDSDVSDYVTVSIGVSTLLPSDGSLEALIKRADDALYRAKENGRNQVQLQSD